MSTRPATEADMLTEALRLAGVDVSTITGEQIERAAAEYTRMSLADVTSKVSRIDDLAVAAYRARLAFVNPSLDHSYYSGVVHGLEVAAGVVRGRVSRRAA